MATNALELVDRKHQKKLRKFLSPEVSAPNKFSAIVYFTGSKCQEEDAKDKVYKTYNEDIFKVLLETYDIYLSQLKLKGKSHESEVAQYLDVIRKLMSYQLPTMRKNPTYQEHFREMLLHLLHTQNKHNIRRDTFQHVLLELIAQTPEDDLLILLPYAIDLAPFSPNENIILPYLSEQYKDIIPLVPKEGEHTAAQTADETIEFLSMFLDFFNRFQDKFEYWFGVFKKYFIVSLYPKVSKEMGWSHFPDNVGFVKLCPSRLQEVVVSKLGECMMDRKQQCHHLWADQGNSTLMLEMYRQGLIVPPGDVQRALLDAYYKVLFTDPVEVPPEKLHAYRKFFIEPLPLIIRGDAKPGPELLLLLHLERIFRTSVIKIWHKLEPEMCEKLMMASLKLTTNLLKREASEDAANALVGEIVLFTWVHTQVMNDAHWDILRQELGTILHRKEVIETIKAKLLQMTYFISQYLYTFEKYERNIKRILKCAKHSGYSMTPDGRKLDEKFKKFEPVTSNDNWDPEGKKAITIWLYLIDIFRQLNVTGDGGKQRPIDPQIHVLICRAMKKVINSLITAYEVSDFKAEPDPTRPQISLVQIFGPWLFETILDLPEEYMPGKAIAMKALCRIFCRHSQDRYPSSILSRYFETLRVGLTKYSDTPISWAIIDTTVSIFSLSFPGANILIPYYLFEISRVFLKEKQKLNKPGPQPPAQVRERALLILASLVSYPRHFRDMQDIPLILSGIDSANTYTTSTTLANTTILFTPSESIQEGPLIEEDRQEDDSGGEESETSGSEEAESDAEAMEAEEDEDRLGEEWIENSRDAYQMFGPKLHYADLQKILSRLLHFSLKHDTEPKHSHNAISILGVLILEELYKDIPDKGYITIEIHRLLRQTMSPTNYLTAHRTLQTFALFYNKLEAVDEDNIKHTIHDLCVNIIENIQNQKLVKVIVEHYTTLLMWLCCAPPKLYDDRRLVRIIFTTIENALAHERKKKGGRAENAGDIIVPNVHQEIQNEAQKLLMALLNFVHNFPTNGHFDIMSTQGMTEMDRESVLFTSLNDLFIYSHYDIPKEGPLLPESPNEALEQLMLAYLEPRASGITPAHRRMALYFQNFLRNKITEGNYLMDLLADLIQYKDNGPLNSSEWREEATAIVARYPLDTIFAKDYSSLIPPPDIPVGDFNCESLSKLHANCEELLLGYYNEFKDTDMFQSGKEALARFTARDVTGGFSWDSQLVFDYPPVVSRNPDRDKLKDLKKETSTNDGPTDENEETEKPPTLLLSGITTEVKSQESEGALPEMVPTVLMTEDLPSAPDDENFRDDGASDVSRASNRKNAGEGRIRNRETVSEQVTHLGQLLDHLEKTQTLNDPSVTQNPPSQQFASFQTEIDQVLLKIQQQQDEDKCIEEQQKQQGLPLSIPASLPPPPITTGPFRKSRLFLSHTGSLSFSTRNNFRMINYEDVRFKRFLKEFDKIQGRTPIKVGLLYVARGQEEESEIFKNDNPSNLYKEFVQGLAAIVDLKKHSGYAAALEKHRDVGEDLPYYSTPWVELAFHEPVRMPNVDREEHLVMKKRHVGNDLIHVIWSEHELDYQTSTIVSQFNAAHVIIYPLRNGLFRIQIAKKANVANIGPLIHNMVLRKELLPDLCRQTAINANIVSRGSSFEGPYEQRIKKLGDMHVKWGVEPQNYTNLVSKAL